MTQVTRGGVLPEVARMVADVVGEELPAGLEVTGETALHGELALEGIEVAALSERLRQSYGERVDLTAFLAGLDFERVLALTVGDLAAHVESRLS
jgi:acyl carrier protein